jgi:macrolide glycosyltransferase
MVAAGAHGHVNPNLPVIAELVARGHRVRYAVPEPFVEAAAATGATPLVTTSVLPGTPGGPERWPDDPVAGMELFLDEAVHVLPQLVAALDDDRPDLLLADIGGYPARVLAHRWDVPLLQLSPAMVAWEGYEADNPEVVALLHDDPRGVAYLRRFADWLAAERIDLDPETFVGRPPRSVVLIPRVLQPHADRVDEATYTFVGPCLDARPHQGDWPAPDRPLVLVSMGSAYTADADFYRTCATAFGDGTRRVVLALGGHLDPADLGELPDGVEAHPWVPQLAVLRRASLFVTHAGMGGCSEGLATGVPMIAVPRAVDQFSNAAALAAAGVGVVVDAEEVSVDALRRAATALDDDEVRRRCAAAAAELGAAGGAARAAEVACGLVGTDPVCRADEDSRGEAT